MLIVIVIKYRLDGNSALERLEVVDEVIITSKSSNKCSIGKSITNNKSVYGYYYENNQYYINQNIEMNNINPFSGEPTLVVGMDNPLYGYCALAK